MANNYDDCLLHLLEQFYASDWSRDIQFDVVPHMRQFSIFEDVDAKVIVLGAVLGVIGFLDELVGVVALDFAGFEVGAGGKEGLGRLHWLYYTKQKRIDGLFPKEKGRSKQKAEGSLEIQKNGGL